MKRLCGFVVRASLQVACWDRHDDVADGHVCTYWFQRDEAPSSWVVETHGGPDGSLVVGDSHLPAGEWEDALWQQAPPGCESILVASCYPGSYTPRDSRIQRLGAPYLGVVRVRYGHAGEGTVMELAVMPMDGGEEQD